MHYERVTNRHSGRQTRRLWHNWARRTGKAVCASDSHRSYGVVNVEVRAVTEQFRQATTINRDTDQRRAGRRSPCCIQIIHTSSISASGNWMSI